VCDSRDWRLGTGGGGSDVSVNVSVASVIARRVPNIGIGLASLPSTRFQSRPTRSHTSYSQYGRAAMTMEDVCAIAEIGGLGQEEESRMKSVSLTCGSDPSSTITRPSPVFSFRRWRGDRMSRSTSRSRRSYWRLGTGGGEQDEKCEYDVWERVGRD
jgi:hypothetical protein